MSEKRDLKTAVISCRGLAKTFYQGKVEVPVLTGIDLEVTKGGTIAVVGASGSGKSTLLHLLGGLDAATSGSISILGQDITVMNETTRGKMRNETLGFVYQFHHLLPEFSALENVAMPLLIRRVSRGEAHAQAEKILGEVGLGHRLTHTPGELSGGERQRAALARALVTQPVCVLADEPTGNLDRKNAEVVFDLLLELNARLGTSLVMVTHDRELARRAQRVLELKDGKLSALAA